VPLSRTACRWAGPRAAAPGRPRCRAGPSPARPSGGFSPTAGRPIFR